MKSELKSASKNHSNHNDEFKAVSKAAVACLVFAILSAAAFMSELFVILPIIGIGCGMAALAGIRRYPDELVGKILARIGLLVCAVMLIGSVAMHSYIYATEVPPDHRRISFSDLRNNKKTNLPYSEKAKEFDGQKVFIKGYVRPPSGKKKRLKNFIMVGDFGDCCFGGNPKITEVIAVKISSNDTVDYSYGLRRIGGTFRLNPNTRPVNEKEVPQVFYEIEANHVR